MALKTDSFIGGIISYFARHGTIANLLLAIMIVLGVVSINAFVFVVAYIVWTIMKATIGIRLSKEGETKGTDVTETGVIAYAIRD